MVVQNRDLIKAMLVDCIMLKRDHAKENPGMPLPQVQNS